MFIRAQPHQHYLRRHRPRCSFSCSCNFKGSLGRQRSVMDNSNSAAATSTDQPWHSPICNNFRDGGAASNTHQRLLCVHIRSSSNLSGFSVSDRATGTAATTAVYQPSASATALRAHLPQQQFIKLQRQRLRYVHIFHNSSFSSFSIQRVPLRHFGVVQATAATVSASAFSVRFATAQFSDSGNSAVRLCSATTQRQPQRQQHHLHCSTSI